MPDNSNLKFNISLTVLNSLGRNLYRDFVTIIGEAISNSWDADANHVNIEVDKDGNKMTISDDGIGMSSNDFVEKFLKIGYSKRKNGDIRSGRGRPFIGRKGIGKLALLSCAKRITIISRVEGGKITGGTIDNGALDEAIKDDLSQNEYQLEPLTQDDIELASSLAHGTIINFTDLKEGIIGNLERLRTSLALYFRFSTIDSNFEIVLNNEAITLDDLKTLIGKTEFLWCLNSYNDELTQKLQSIAKNTNNIESDLSIEGFIASVDKPSNLKISGTDEKVGIDVFVNGRLRERNMLRHVQTARVPESYLYGQIYFNELDDGTGIDRFTSSREGIVADDELFRKMIEALKDIVKKIIDEWDRLRLEANEDGDDENVRKSKRDRASRKLFTETAKEYTGEKTTKDKNNIVKKWVNVLQEDAEFNFSSYAECFISENLLRKYIESKNLKLTRSVQSEANKWRKRESDNKKAANMEIQISQEDDDKNYLGMHELIMVVDPANSKGSRSNKMDIDEAEYVPLRNAVMHTARLSEEAKTKLTTVFNNIKAKVKRIISNS